MDRSSNGLGPRHDASSRVQKPDLGVDKMAALKARVAAAIDGSKAKGGLSVGLHPALENLSTWKPPSKSKDAGSQAKNQRQPQTHQQQRDRQSPGAAAPRLGDGQSNPYLDESQASQPAGGKQRKSRQLVFNQKGKYIAQANALRRQTALDAMRKRIAEQTRKAGIDDDIDVEKNFVIEEPPEIEWWDEGLINGNNYDNIDDPAALKIGTPESIITEYIQHPVAVEPPQDRHAPAAKPLYLTSKEQAKLRRQRRMADLKEMQAKIRLGLVPAPPPKVKKGNLMRVLGDGMLIPSLIFCPTICLWAPANFV
jgi:U4/U6 small nuclear ribonucleoprotein PRP3